MTEQHADVAAPAPPRAWAAVGLALLLAMAVGVGLLDSSDQMDRGREASPTPSSTLPGYPSDSASVRPVIPWLAAPAPPVPTPPGPVAPCPASQLRARDIGGEGATGHAAHVVEVTNASAQPCSLEGEQPLLELRDAQGRLVVRSGTQVPFICSGCGANRTPGPLFVPPLSSLRYPHEYGDSTSRPDIPGFTLSQGPCPGGVFPEGAGLFLVLPTGRGRVPIADAVPPPFDYRCDLGPDEYPPPGRPQLRVGFLVGIPVVDFVDNRKVTMEIAAPPRVRAGSSLRYRIRSRVAGSVFLAHLGCPGYTQRLLGVTEERHQLNCEALEDFPERRILPDQWFDMVLHVPKDAPAGPKTLAWELDPPFRAARASATVEITPQ